jgi:hypothetical protein
MRSKVIELKFVHGATQADILAVTGCKSSTISRWCLDPGNEFRIGRPPYMHPEDFDLLFLDKIPKAAAEHEPMSMQAITQEVN